MKCAIMQPTYLPWLGYFHLINSVNNFVFYDDAQYSKGSWHNRNRLVYCNNIKWLTVPISKNKLGDKIKDIKINYSKNWTKNHFSLIEQTYHNCPYFNDLVDILNLLEFCNFNKLSDLNISLIKLICQKLNFKKSFYLSSNLKTSGGRTSRLIDICSSLNSSIYISPQGSREYLEKDGDFTKSNISLEFHEFEPKKYKQLNIDVFNGYLSIIDIIANIGWVNLIKYFKQENKEEQ